MNLIRKIAKLGLPGVIAGLMAIIAINIPDIFLSKGIIIFIIVGVSGITGGYLFQSNCWLFVSVSFATFILISLMGLLMGVDNKTLVGFVDGVMLAYPVLLAGHFIGKYIAKIRDRLVSSAGSAPES